MIRLDVSDDVDVLVVTTDLATEGTLVSRVPGARYMRKGDVWRLPLTYAAAEQLRGIAGSRLQLAPPAARAVSALAHAALTAENSKQSATVGRVEGDMPHQTTGVRFLVTARRAILGDEPGLGKTKVALTSLDLPALVICPTTLRQVWADEAAKWRPELAVQVIGGTAVQRRKQIAAEADLYVVGYEAAVKHTRLAPFGSTKLTDDERTERELNARAWNTVIVDEAHNLANPGAKRTRAAWHLADSAKRVYALTGTPIRNRPSDFWSLLRLADAESWPVKSKWLDRYAVLRLNHWGGVVDESFEPTTKAELDHLVAPFFLRRTKAEVLPDLPPKLYSTRHLEMGARQAKAYKTMKDTMLAEVADGSLLVAPNPAQKFMRLLQIASATPLSLDEGTLELGLPSCKVEAVLDLAAERAGLPTVAFSVSRRLSRLVGAQLAKAGYSVGFVDGAEAPGARSRAVENFQAGELDWILCTYGAGGTGITLHRSDTLLRIQRPFSRVDDLQGADRIHRLGQSAESVHYIDLVTTGTAERRVIKILEGKGELMEAVCRDKDRLTEMLEAA